MLNIHQATNSDVLDHLKIFFVVMGLVNFMMLGIMIIIIIQIIKNNREISKNIIFFCVFVFIVVNGVFVLSILFDANKLSKKNVLTIDKTVTVQNKVETNNDSHWTFKHKGQMYKVDMSSMRGYSNDTNVNNGDKVTLKANDYFIKGHTINMDDVDYEIK